MILYMMPCTVVVRVEDERVIGRYRYGKGFTVPVQFYVLQKFYVLRFTDALGIIHYYFLQTIAERTYR